MQHALAAAREAAGARVVGNKIGLTSAAVQEQLGDRRPYCEVPWFWSDQYDLNLQVAGHPDAAGEIAWRGEPRHGSFAAFYLRGG